MTISAGKCGFGHICRKNPKWKTSFFCAVVLALADIIYNISLYLYILYVHIYLYSGVSKGMFVGRIFLRLMSTISKHCAFTDTIKPKWLPVYSNLLYFFSQDVAKFILIVKSTLNWFCCFSISAFFFFICLSHASK